MAKSNVVKLKIDQEVKGKENVDELTVSLKSLKEATANIQKTSKIIDTRAFADALDTVNNAVSKVTSVMSDLSAAYAVQEQAEVQLATVMRERMSASEADIQAIKDLASAQQELGIIGDEVQLAGAQQVATFLTQRSTLETLIPAMNNLIAQQKGYNATSGDAVTVANLMGKAMMGQTSALRRCGITFTEAQEQVMKYGNEEERASMLAQIITDNVGNMNQELAKTSSGQMKQLSNTLGDIKESIGKFAQKAMPFMTMVATSVNAATAVGKVVVSIKLLNDKVKLFTRLGALATATSGMMSNAFRRSKIVMDIFRNSLTNASAGALALKIALKSLLISSGVGLAIWAVTEAIDYFCNSADDAADKVDILKEANDNFTSNAARAEAEVRKDIETLNALCATNKDTTATVESLNQKYGESLGHYKTANEWIEVLTKNVKLYAEANAYAAMMEELTAKKLELQWKNRELKKDGVITYAGKNIDYEAFAKNYEKDNALGGRIWEKAKKEGVTDNWVQYENNLQEIENINSELDYVIGKSQKAQAALAKVRAGSTGDPVKSSDKGKGVSTTAKRDKANYSLLAKNLKEYEANVTSLNDKLQTANAEEAASINMEIEYWKAKADAIRNAGKEVEEVANKTSDAVKEESKQIDITELSTEKGREKLTTIKDISEAVNALEDAMQTATADEMLGYEKTIRLLNKKRDALNRSSEILDNQETIDKLNRLGGRELKVKIASMGFDSLTDKIREIDEMLNDLDNPPTDGQRKMLESQRAQYSAWRKQVAYSFDTYRNGWSAIQGTGDGIKSITSAIEGNGDAWSKITGIINGVLQVYDSISGIIGIVNTLTAASKAGTAAEATKAATSTASATAMGVQAAEAGVSAAASVPLIAANKATAASYMEVATAAYLAAHAYIPFAGLGIGAGYATAAKALVLGMGATAFAEGGIISGPTLGLMGEYPGAKNNPEIVAPLDKLRSYIEPQGGMKGEVEFKIKGRRLVGIFNKEQSYYSRM